VNLTNPFHRDFRRSLEIAVKPLGVELVASEADLPDDLYDALQRLARERVKIALILQDSMFLNERKRNGNPYPAARIHCHAWRRGSVAARGARAAAEGLAHRGSRSRASNPCHVERVP
jgi:hypothetical protein